MTNSGLKPQPDEDSNDSNCSAMHNEMPPDESGGDTNISKMLKMPTDGHLQAEDSGAGVALAAPPDGADLELLDDKNYVQSSENGDTLDQTFSDPDKYVKQARRTALKYGPGLGRGPFAQKNLVPLTMPYNEGPCHGLRRLLIMPRWSPCTGPL